MLENGIAVTITPIKRFHNYLRSRIAGLEPVRRFEEQKDYDSEHGVVSDIDDLRGIRFDEKRPGKNDFMEEIKSNTLKITEILNRMDKLFEMVENTSNHDRTIKI